jgi:TolA-binding protein
VGAAPGGFQVVQAQAQVQTQAQTGGPEEIVRAGRQAEGGSGRRPGGRARGGREVPAGAYDLGMKHYTEEDYAEAQDAWRAAIRLGPNTALAGQARENLKKTEQILKTLQEMKR